MAAHTIDVLQLGRGAGTDFIGVSFSSLDLIGHAFGPESHEVQDAVIRLDRTIGKLLAHLDTTVGRDNYVLALSSDHGVAGVPEQVTGGGRHSSAEVRAAIDGALTSVFGPPPPAAPRPGAAAGATPPRASYMAYSAYTDVYLAPGVMDRLKAEPKGMKAVLEALRAMPGMMQAFAADDVSQAAARQDADPVRRAAALSYHAGRSGDIIVVPRENWILSSSATTHGTLHPYDQRVPVIVFGAGVKAGRYAADATPADVAPTLAALARIAVEPADGRVLSDSMVRTPDSK
jgi:arylsulfatase A-like enzyme